MLFMVIESFKNRDAGAVGKRFKLSGRMLPEGVALPGELGGFDGHAVFPDHGSAGCGITQDLDQPLE